jgi:hypothetical protein
VYRRDSIDATHYPVFHQMEGVRVFSPADWEGAGMGATEFAEKELKAALEVGGRCRGAGAPGVLGAGSGAPARRAQQSLATPAAGAAASAAPLTAAARAPHPAARIPPPPPPPKPDPQGLARHLFGDIECRWVDAYFPFTEPSFELEIFFNGKWLEVRLVSVGWGALWGCDAVSMGRGWEGAAEARVVAAAGCGRDAAT